jgi:hypothetical protein
MLWRTGVERDRPECRLDGARAVSGDGEITGKSTAYFCPSLFVKRFQLRIELSDLVGHTKKGLRLFLDVTPQAVVSIALQDQRFLDMLNGILARDAEPQICVLAPAKGGVEEPDSTEAVTVD